MKKQLKSCVPALLAAATTVPLLSCCSSEPQKPNIIVILADDMGYGDVSVLNRESKIRTPHLDSMAAQGVIFSDAHTPSSVSTPTRYGLLTGRYNWRSHLKSGVLSGYSKPLIPTERSTVGSMLQRAGYTTACIGKWHLGWEWDFTEPPTNIDELSENGKGVVNFSTPIVGGPTSIGFDYFYGIAGSLDMPPYVYVHNDKVTALPDRKTVNQGKYSWWRRGDTGADFNHEECLPHLTDKAIEFVAKAVEGENPFFIYLPYPGPHTPILPTEQWQGISGVNPYADFTMMLDDEIGRLMAALKAEGIDENTLVIFTTDNGCSPAAAMTELAAKGHQANYIYRGAKADLFEGGHRVPFIVSWPQGIETSGVCNQTICLTDLYATFADIVGEPLPAHEAEDSYSILPAIENSDYTEPIREATVHHSIDGSFAIRRGEWKLLLVPHSGGWSAPTPNNKKALEGLPPMQLYNLSSDPSEKENLYEQYPDIVEELRSMLVGYIVQGRSTPGQAQSNDGEYPWVQIKEILN